jgi:two-component system, NtrC family, sensor kinase
MSKNSQLDRNADRVERAWDLIWRPGEALEAWALRMLHVIRHQVPLLSAAFYAAMEEKLLTPIAVLGRPREKLLPLAWGEGPAGEAAQRQIPIYLRLDTQNSHPLAIGALPEYALWTLPCLYQHQTWGVLELLLYDEPTPAQQEALHDILPLLSALLSSAIQQHRINQLLINLQNQNALLEAKIREASEARSELETLNATLERRVEERTAELQKALQNLRSTQEQLIFSEKMAALGQLIAGIAHEINSPLGAIKGSAETLIETLPNLLRLLSSLQARDPQTISNLWSWIQNTLLAKERPILTSREERALRKRFAARLEKAGLPDAESAARRLVEAGLHQENDLDPILSLLHIPETIDLIYLLGQLRLQLENILLASQRTRKVVFALKSYVHTSGDRSTPVLTDLPESIDTILTLYQNQLKQGVEVETYYDPALPKLYLFADEIGQVWTNIIQNAIQAMNGQGRLRIEAQLNGDFIRVSFTDNGPGIPPEILPRIFEPFFTTKSRGEGTGLGLDICRRIVEKHHGRIEVSSQPGQTTFHVLLPRLLAQNNWYHAQPAHSSA